MWPTTVEMTRDQCRGFLRRSELESYGSVINTFRAQGGLSETKIKLLKDLRDVFHISQERHKAEARRVSNDEVLCTVAEMISGPNTGQEWCKEGRRSYPLLPRSAPHTALIAIANNAQQVTLEENKKLPLPSETVDKFKNINDERPYSQKPIVIEDPHLSTNNNNINQQIQKNIDHIDNSHNIMNIVGSGAGGGGGGGIIAPSRKRGLSETVPLNHTNQRIQQLYHSHSKLSSQMPSSSSSKQSKAQSKRLTQKTKQLIGKPPKAPKIPGAPKAKRNSIKSNKSMAGNSSSVVASASLGGNFTAGAAGSFAPSPSATIGGPPPMSLPSNHPNIIERPILAEPFPDKQFSHDISGSLILSEAMSQPIMIHQPLVTQQEQQHHQQQQQHQQHHQQNQQPVQIVFTTQIDPIPNDMSNNFMDNSNFITESTPIDWLPKPVLPTTHTTNSSRQLKQLITNNPTTTQYSASMITSTPILTINPTAVIGGNVVTSTKLVTPIPTTTTTTVAAAATVSAGSTTSTSRKVINTKTNTTSNQNIQSKVVKNSRRKLFNQNTTKTLPITAPIPQQQPPPQNIPNTVQISQSPNQIIREFHPHPGMQIHSITNSPPIVNIINHHNQHNQIITSTPTPTPSANLISGIPAVATISTIMSTAPLSSSSSSSVVTGTGRGQKPPPKIHVTSQQIIAPAGSTGPIKLPSSVQFKNLSTKGNVVKLTQLSDGRMIIKGTELINNSTGIINNKTTKLKSITTIAGLNTTTPNTSIGGGGGGGGSVGVGGIMTTGNLIPTTNPTQQNKIPLQKIQLMPSTNKQGGKSNMVVMQKIIGPTGGRSTFITAAGSSNLLKDKNIVIHQNKLTKINHQIPILPQPQQQQQQNTVVVLDMTEQQQRSSSLTGVTTAIVTAAPPPQPLPSITTTTKQSSSDLSKQMSIKSISGRIDQTTPIEFIVENDGNNDNSGNNVITEDTPVDIIASDILTTENMVINLPATSPAIITTAPVVSTAQIVRHHQQTSNTTLELKEQKNTTQIMEHLKSKTTVKSVPITFNNNQQQQQQQINNSTLTTMASGGVVTFVTQPIIKTGQKHKIVRSTSKLIGNKQQNTSGNINIVAKKPKLTNKTVPSVTAATRTINKSSTSISNISNTTTTTTTTTSTDWEAELDQAHLTKISVQTPIKSINVQNNIELDTNLTSEISGGNIVEESTVEQVVEQQNNIQTDFIENDEGELGNYICQEQNTNDDDDIIQYDGEDGTEMEYEEIQNLQDDNDEEQQQHHEDSVNIPSEISPNLPKTNFTSAQLTHPTTTTITTSSSSVATQLDNHPKQSSHNEIELSEPSKLNGENEIQQQKNEIDEENITTTSNTTTNSSMMMLQMQEYDQNGSSQMRNVSVEELVASGHIILDGNDSTE